MTEQDANSNAQTVSIPDGVIPEQLRNGKFRFIKLANPSKSPRMPRSGKEAIEKGWNNDRNYAYDDPDFTKFIEKHNNYGVLPLEDICIFDVDDYDGLDALDTQGRIKFHELFDDTFTVISGHESGKHMHFYFKIESEDRYGKKIVLNDKAADNKHYGELYFGGCKAYVVGPYSKHDSGRLYLPKNSEIKTISQLDLEDFINTFIPESFGEQYNKNIPKSTLDVYAASTDSITNQLGLKIEDLAMPTDAIYLGDGEYQGSHPVHGSSTHHNFNINTEKNVWKCFRCDSGGDPAIWLAVEYGIIDCSQAHPGILSDDNIFTQLRECMEKDPRFSDQMKRNRLLFEEKKRFEKFERLCKSKDENNEFVESDEEISDEFDNSDEFESDKSSIPKDTIQTSFKVKTLEDKKFVNEVMKSADFEQSSNDYNTSKSYSSEKIYYSSDGEVITGSGSEFDPNSRRLIQAAMMYGNDVTSKILEGDSHEIIEMKQRNISKLPKLTDMEYICAVEDTNFISRYVDAVSKITDAYAEYHYSCALGLLSLIVERKAMIRLNVKRIYPNIWILLLGSSSSSRKSTALGYAKSIAKEINPFHALPEDFTPESLIESLSSDLGQSGEIIANSNKWLIKDEAGSILSAMLSKQYMGGLLDLFCLLYDGSDYTRKLRSKKDNKSEFNIKDPYVTFIWATTSDSFRDYTNKQSLKTGFLYRFLFLNPHHMNRTVKPLEFAMGSHNTTRVDVERQNLVNDLRDRYFIFEHVSSPIEFYMDAESVKFFQSWQMLRERQCMEKGDDISTSMLSRNIITAIKLAMLFQIGSEKFIKLFNKHNIEKIANGFEGKIKIEYRYIVEACRQIDEYFYPMGVYAAIDATVDMKEDLMARILAIVRNEPDGRITRTKLSRSMHLLGKELDDILFAMMENKEISMKKVYGNSKKPTTWITALEIDDSDTTDYSILDGDEIPYTSKGKSPKKSDKPNKSTKVDIKGKSNNIPTDNGEIDYSVLDD